MSELKIAAAYIRVSTDDQMEYSPDSQIKAVREYAKNNGYLLPDDLIFMEDEGRSGRKAAKRPEFLRMIATAKSKPKPFDVILVWKFSRFARNREDSIVYKSMLRKQCGIDVISISEPIGDDKTAILIEALLEAMDEYYSINLGEEVKRGMTEKVSRGEPVSIPAFGYYIKGKQYYPALDTAPIVKMIYDDFLSGMGYRDIAIKLNNMGIVSSRGNRFENRTVEYILRNPVYIGKIRWNPTEMTRRNYDHPDIMTVDGSHEQIVDTDTWHKTQEIIAKKKLMYAKHSRERQHCATMLHGLVKCSNCGSTLVQAAVGSYQCHLYAKGKCNISHSITISRLEDMVFSKIEADFISNDFQLIRKSPTLQSGAESNVIDIQLLREEQKLIRVREAYENGIDTLDEYKVNKSRITDRIKELSQQRPKAKQVSPQEAKKSFMHRHKGTIKTIQDDNVTPEEKNKLLRTFIDHIVFDRTHKTVQVFYYD